MAPVSEADIRKLQAARIAPVAIEAYKRGTAAPGVLKQIQSVLQSSTAANSRNNLSWATGNNPIIPNTPAGAAGGLGGQVVKTGPVKTGAVPTGPRGGVPAHSGASGTFPKTSPWGQKFVDIVKGAVGGIKPTSAGSSSRRETGKQGSASTGSVFEGLDFPDYDYVPPTIQMRDFTDEANANVDKAFAPLFAAYAQQKQDINTKSGQDRQVVGGLYDQYVKSIAEGAADTDKRYDAAGAERAQQGQALGSTVGNYYQSANSNTADLLKSIGAQQAAPELLQQGANEQAVQQSQVGQGTQAMQDYYGQQNQGAQDQAVGYQDAARNESVRGQANVLADAAAQIGGVNRQEAGSHTEAGKTALDIAQQLANRDFQVQQTNVGNAANAYNANYQGEVGNYNAARQNILDQQDLDYKTTQLGQGQQQIDIERDKAAGAGAGSGVNPTGLNATTLQLGDQIGQQAVADITRTINEVTVGSGVRAGDPDKMGNAYIAMLSKANEVAQRSGVPVSSVQNAMIQMWKDSFGAADSIPAPKVFDQR
jgi:hypothetical protein